MTSSSIRLCGSILVMLWSGHTAMSQETEMVALPRYHVPAPDYAGMQRNWARGMKIVNFWLNKYADVNLANRLGDIHNEAVEASMSLVDWTNLGVLYEIRVYRYRQKNDAGLYPAYIESEKASKVGVGASPMEALFRAEDTIRPGAEDGYSYDQAYSHYFFVKREADGSLKGEVVPRGTSIKLTQDVMGNFGDLQLEYGVQAFEDGERYANIAKAARKRLKAIEQIRRLEETERVLVESAKRVANIEKGLAEAADQAKKAADQAQLIGILSTVVGAAELAVKVDAAIGDPALDLDGVDSPQTLLQKVETYRDEKMEITRTLTVRLRDGEASFLQSVQDFQNAIAPANPPSDVGKLLAP